MTRNRRLLCPLLTALLGACGAQPAEQSPPETLQAALPGRCPIGEKPTPNGCEPAIPTTWKSVWVGTAPFCEGSPADCDERNMIHVASDGSGDGASCVFGEKVLCGCFAPTSPRPFYVIEHRKNSVEEVWGAMFRGANAVEFDVRHQASTGRFCVNHDTTLFCDRDELVGFLRGVRQVADAPNSSLAMVFVDFKDADGRLEAAQTLLGIVRRELTEPTGVKVVLSMSKLEKARPQFPRVGRDLRPGEGLAIDEEDSADGVARFFADRGIGRAAFGNGTFVAGISIDIRGSIIRAIQLRDQGWFRFVYVWTLANEYSMRDYLRLGVNGILVNDSRDLRKVLDESCFPVRLATRADNPFE
jgi:glycerophosphoryl diester phosphodiesterase